MHALVRFAHIAAANTFTTAEIHPLVIEALGCPPERYSLASLRYDLSKLRAKGLLTRLPHSRRYQLSLQGYSISLVFLKLFEVSSIHSKPMLVSNMTGAPNSIASTNVSSTTWTPSFAPSDSTLRQHEIMLTTNKNKFSLPPQ